MFHRNYSNILPRHKNTTNYSVNLSRLQNVVRDSHRLDIVKCLRRLESRLFDNLCATRRSYRAIVEDRSRELSERLRTSRGFQVISSWSGYVRNRSVNIYKSLDACFSAKVRRTQRLWSDTYSRNVLGRVRIAFGRYGRMGLVMSATGVYNNSRNEGDSGKYDWSNRNISDKEMKTHLGDLDLADQLCETLICKTCLCRIKINQKKENVKYCVCKEKDRASTEQLGWRPYMETEDLIIWRQEQKDHGLYAYKVYGTYKDVCAADLLGVHTDCEYRKSWDPTLVTVDTIESLHERCGKGDVIHWVVEWPSFFANREYVFERRYRLFSASEYCEVVSSLPSNEQQSQEAIVIISRSCEHPDKPEHSRAVRVHQYWSNIVIRPYGDINEKGVEFTLTYFDSAGLGSIGGAAAAAAASWAAGRGAPEYFRQMHEAARKYTDWKEKYGDPNIDDDPLVPCPHPDTGKEEDPPQGSNSDEHKMVVPQSSFGEQTGSPRKVNIATTPAITKKQLDKSQDVGDTRTDDALREPRSGQETKYEKRTKMTEPESESLQPERADVIHAGESTTPPRQETSVQTNGWWRYLHPYYYFA